VIHWPLLMLTLSVAQNWMGSSFLRTSVVALCAGFAVMAICLAFAAIFERQSFYRRCLTATIRPKPAKSPLPENNGASG
jgi:hypothetical protein